MRFLYLLPLLLVFGCEPQPNPQPTPNQLVHSHKHVSDQAAVSLIDYERARAFPPHAVVFTQGNGHSPTPGPTPEPTPGPTPGAKCEKCNGTGVFRPDGAIDRPCPQCGGDGVTSVQDLQKYIASVEKPNQEDLEAFRLGLTREQVQDAKNMGWTLERYSALSKRVAALESGSSELKQQINETDKIFHDLGEELKESSGAYSERVNIKWLKDPEDGYKESRRTGKPALIYWTGMNCAPCRRMEQEVISKSEVSEFLSQNFVCVKVDVESFPRERLAKYRITRMPSFSVIPADWSDSKKLKNSFDPTVFVARLRGSQEWVKGVLASGKSSRVIRYANLQTEDLIAEESAPIIEEDWSESTTVPETQKSTVQPVQYYVMSGSGSNGGRYAGSYYSSSPVYYSSGPSYGSAGGNGGSARYYSSPSYYSGWGGGGWGGYYGGGGGGSMVCGPGGCYITY